MSARRWIRVGVVGLLAVLLASLVAPVSFSASGATGAVAGGPSPPSAAPATATVHSALSGGLQTELATRAKDLYAATGLPDAAKLEPNFGFSDVREGNALVPANLATPQVSPGPTSIGVNDLGLRAAPNGTYVAYSYRTTSLDGTVTIDNLSLLPVMTNASDAITIQENAVLNNVTLFGQSVNQIWAQNVILYSVAGDQLQLLTDAWNFTGPPFALFANDIYAHSPGGFLFGGTYVHQVPLQPPAFHVEMPFTIRLYLNATNIAGRNALFFNYTLASAANITLGSTNFGRTINGGSFDWIIFNSRAGMPASYRAPPASFLISGSQATGLGLANDAEIAFCGPSDGFSADIRSLTATAQLLELNATTGRYAAVPAAFTTTEDTGESVEGVDAHFTASSATNGTALLTNGPEFIYGLWNATASAVHERAYTVDLAPRSALLWVSPDSGVSPAGFNNSSAAWALAPSSRSTFWLPTGPGETYSAAIFANDYAPTYAPIAPGPVSTLSLAPDAAAGLYVPVIAFGNAGVAAIARSGDGSAADPYVVSYSQTTPISALFGVFDEFSEPLYPGLLFSDVTAHVTIVDPPSFAIRYSAADLFPLEYFWGLSVPRTNDLPIEIYDSSNVTIVGASDISGWFPVTQSGFLMSSLFLSNDTDCLVAYDHFASMGSSMVIVGPAGRATGEGNVVFGNRFTTSPITTGPDAADLYVVIAYDTPYNGTPAPGALGVFANGNTIYNNLFATPITAYSPPQVPFLAYVFVNDLGYHDFRAVATTWSDHWSVPLRPAVTVQVVNGIALTGSVVRAPFEGGNAWTNWNGTLPYTDDGLITSGGDALPLPLAGSPVRAVFVVELGLPSGTAWTISLGGTTYTSSSHFVLAYVAPGAVAFSVANSGARVPFPASGTVHVHANVVLWVVFLP